MQQLIKTFAISAFICLVSASTTMAAEITGSDLGKEKRWADQIVEALLDGEAITLNDGKNNFLGILTEAEPAKPVGIILLHGLGAHPDWPQVIHPLRVGLPEQGWTTLSLQMPVLANEAEGKDYAPLIPHAGPRIQAGVDYLKSKGYKKVIIAAHSMGARMSSHALANELAKADGFIAIGMPGGTEIDTAKINMPMLDLIGEQDLAGVIKSASQRVSNAAKNKQYSQIIAKDADHFFNEKDRELTELAIHWLNKH